MNARQRGLGPQFRGTPAPTALRLTATTIDLLLILGVLVLVATLTRSAVWTLVAALDLLGLLWIWQSRAGLSPAHLILGLRTCRDDRPWSPGAGRAMARSVIQGLGFATGGLGAWAVAATAAFDPSGRHRTWADRAGGTVVVKVAPREPAPIPQIPAVAPALGVAQVAPPTPQPPPTPRTLPAYQPTPTHGPPPAPPTTHVDTSGALMISFDTGQREYLPAGSAAVLGRSPSPVEATDTCIAVPDPDGAVSKSHLRVEHGRDGVWLTDLGSTNGTEMLDDSGTTTPLHAGARTLLAEGDRVRVGRRVFTASLMVAEN